MGGRPLRVLLVEDSEDDAALVARELRRYGFVPTLERVETAEAMGAALDRARFDVAIVDYALPRFGALPSLELVRRRALDLPVIIVSGAIGEESAVAAMRAGAGDFIRKGNWARLGPAIERELADVDNRRQRREAEAERARLREREQAALAEARDAVQSRNELLSIVSHDLRSPLATIKGTAQVLQRQLGREGNLDLDRLRDGLARIGATATAMSELLDQLLDLSRLERGLPLDLERQPTDLVALVGRCIDAQSASRGDHPIRLVAPAEPVVGEWDPSRLERVIANLLDNAIKYSPPGHVIEVTVGRDESAPDRFALVRVRDEGLGIPAADLSRVFERFHRGGNVVGRIGGSGVGLANARQIVEQHGGTIEVASEEGVGSTFTVRLPLVPES